MTRKRLHNEMVDLDGSGGYYRVDVLLSADNSNEGHAFIPGLGRVRVYKKMPEYSYQGVSFAWYIRKDK